MNKLCIFPKTQMSGAGSGDAEQDLKTVMYEQICKLTIIKHFHYRNTVR